MTNDNQVYDRLAEKYRLAGDEYFLRLIKSMMTPEEGEYLLALSTPMTPAELAKKPNRDEKCVVGCKFKAMNFELVRPPEFIPPREPNAPVPVYNGVG